MNRERFGPRKSVHQVKFRVTERTHTHTKPNKRAALYASSNKTIDTQQLVQGFGPYHAEIYLLVLSIFVLPGVGTAYTLFHSLYSTLGVHTTGIQEL